MDVKFKARFRKALHTQLLIIFYLICGNCYALDCDEFGEVVSVAYLAQYSVESVEDFDKSVCNELKDSYRNLFKKMGVPDAAAEAIPNILSDWRFTMYGVLPVVFIKDYHIELCNNDRNGKGTKSILALNFKDYIACMEDKNSQDCIKIMTEI